MNNVADIVRKRRRPKLVKICQWVKTYKLIYYYVQTSTSSTCFWED